MQTLVDIVLVTMFIAGIVIMVKGQGYLNSRFQGRKCFSTTAELIGYREYRHISTGVFSRDYLQNAPGRYPVLRFSLLKKGNPVQEKNSMNTIVLASLIPDQGLHASVHESVPVRYLLRNGIKVAVDREDLLSRYNQTQLLKGCIYILSGIILLVMVAVCAVVIAVT